MRIQEPLDSLVTGNGASPVLRFLLLLVGASVAARHSGRSPRPQPPQPAATEVRARRRSSISASGCVELVGTNERLPVPRRRGRKHPPPP
eukprot:7187041-Prymnesium_polylepis.1